MANVASSVEFSVELMSDQGMRETCNFESVKINVKQSV